MDFFQLIITWVGNAPVIIIFGTGLFIWWHWDKIKKAPGVASVCQWLAEGNPLPRASGKHFAVVLAQLENDPEGKHQFLIREALNKISGIEVILIERTISLAGIANQYDAKQAAHDRARTMLKEANAQVMIWGSALEAKDVRAPKRLHWTVVQDLPLTKSHENYRSSDYDLPELFWQDLGDILRLLATTGAAEFAQRSGQFLADELQGFIPRVRAFLASKTLSAAQAAAIRMVLADALATYGEQRGDSKALAEAVVAYREALKEYTRERVPLLWATTQHNLGTALWTLGERESGTEKLDAAVVAYREALKERTRERVPLSWAMTQTCLGTALCTLGERESGMEKLDAAVVAYRAALQEYTQERVPLYWAETQTTLQHVLQMLDQRKQSHSDTPSNQ